MRNWRKEAGRMWDVEKGDIEEGSRVKRSSREVAGWTGHQGREQGKRSSRMGPGWKGPIPLPSYYISTAFSRCFPFTLPYVPIIIKTAVIAALKPNCPDIDLLILLLRFYPPPPIASLPIQRPYLHLISMPPPLPWPCCLNSTSTVALLPYFHLYCGPVALLPPLLWPCCLSSTSIVALLPFYHLYRGPVTLFPPLACTSRLTSTSTVALLPYVTVMRI